MNKLISFWYALIDILDSHNGAITAVATIFIAIFTVVLARSTKKLWGEAKISSRIAEKSIDLMGKEFIANHRPKIVIRRVSPMKDVQNIATGVQYSIHNIGDEIATIVAISEKIWLPDFGENLPPIPPYEPARQVNIMIDSGSFQSFVYDAAPDVRNDLAFSFGYIETFNETLGLNDVGRGADILFLGYVDYLDAAGKKRQTAFLRHFILKTKRFDPIGHPDYEYQD